MCVLRSRAAKEDSKVRHKQERGAIPARPFQKDKLTKSEQDSYQTAFKAALLGEAAPKAGRFGTPYSPLAETSPARAPVTLSMREPSQQARRPQQPKTKSACVESAHNRVRRCKLQRRGMRPCQHQCHEEMTNAKIALNCTRNRAEFSRNRSGRRQRFP